MSGPQAIDGHPLAASFTFSRCPLDVEVQGLMRMNRSRFYVCCMQGSYPLGTSSPALRVVQWPPVLDRARGPPRILSKVGISPAKPGSQCINTARPDPSIYLHRVLEDWEGDHPKHSYSAVEVWRQCGLIFLVVFVQQASF